MPSSTSSNGAGSTLVAVDPRAVTAALSAAKGFPLAKQRSIGGRWTSDAGSADDRALPLEACFLAGARG